MKVNSETSIKSLLVALCIAILISCGGGGGGGDDDSADVDASNDDSSSDDSSAEATTDNTSVITADFDLFEQTGVWVLRLTAHESFDEDFTLGGNTVNTKGILDLSQQAHFILEKSGSLAIYTTCGISPEVEEIAEIALVEDDDEFFVTDEHNPGQCVNIKEEYVKVSDEEYRYEYSCGPDVDFVLEITKFGDEPEFNFGSLAFTSALNSDLSVSNGVCGAISKLETIDVVTPEPNIFGLESGSAKFNNFNVAAPYKGSQIVISFNFTDDMRVGTYTVVNAADASDEVAVSLESVIFGGTPANPDTSSADGGTVSISAICKPVTTS